MNIFNQGQKIFRMLFPKKKIEIEGKAFPVGISVYQKNNTLEPREVAIRDQYVGTQLIELTRTCYEVTGCVRMLLTDAFSCQTGDNSQVWQIGNYVDKEQTIPVNSELKDIVVELQERERNDSSDKILGGEFQTAMKNIIRYGDAFSELAISKSKKGYFYISNFLTLPTWELFRCENNQGELIGFEQYGNQNQKIIFNPQKVIHFRYEKNRLYGESIFIPCCQFWEYYQESSYNLMIASRTLAQNPNVHTFSEKMDAPQQMKYKQAHEEQKYKEGLLTDIFLQYGMEVSKISNVNPSLKPLIDVWIEWRGKMIPPGIPTYAFPNFPSQKARDVSGIPNQGYIKLVNSFRQSASQGLRNIIKTELILRKGLDWYLENGKYQIEWDNWIINQGNPNDPVGNQNEQDDDYDQLKDRGDSDE